MLPTSSLALLHDSSRTLFWYRFFQARGALHPVAALASTEDPGLLLCRWRGSGQQQTAQAASQAAHGIPVVQGTVAVWDTLSTAAVAGKYGRQARAARWLAGGAAAAEEGLEP